MKVIVTGANGYIGRRLCKRLSEMQGINVTGLTIDKTEENGINHTDFSVENLACHFTGADIIIHLASVRAGNRICDFSANESITENVLIAMEQAGIERFVFASSIAVYSDVSRIPWLEEMQLKPVSLYGISKVACENLFQYYALREKLKGIILRFAPVYGEHDTNKRMVSAFISKAKAHETLMVNSISNSKRDFIYREDFVDALIWSIMLNSNGVEIYNIGSGEPKTNYEIATIINRAFGNSNPVLYLKNNPETMPSAYFDITKAYKAGFVPSYNMETAMARIVHLEGYADDL